MGQLFQTVPGVVFVPVGEELRLDAHYRNTLPPQLGAYGAHIFVQNVADRGGDHHDEPGAVAAPGVPYGLAEHLKCNMQKSVMLGNYEFFYAAGLMRKLYNIEIRTDMEPEQILEAILQMQDNLAPQSEQEKYLIQIIKNYEPSADHDAQMDELFAWGEQEPDMWQVTTSFHPVIR